MEISIQEQIAQTIRYALKFRSEIGHPNNKMKKSEKLEKNLKDYEIIEVLIPSVIDNITKIAYEETFGQVSGSNLTRSMKIKTFMSKRYDNLREIIGEKRFDKYVDFPEKNLTSGNQKFTAQQIESKFVKSVIQLYLTAAKRDLSVFQVELLPIIREWVKISLESIDNKGTAIDPLSLDKITREFLKIIDLGRVEDDLKNIVRDLQTYSMLIFFIKKFPDYGSIAEGSELVSILDKIRDIMFQIVQGLHNFPRIDEKILQSYEISQK